MKLIRYTFVVIVSILNNKFYLNFTRTRVHNKFKEGNQSYFNHSKNTALAPLEYYFITKFKEKIISIDSVILLTIVTSYFDEKIHPIFTWNIYNKPMEEKEITSINPPYNSNQKISSDLCSCNMISRLKLKLKAKKKDRERIYRTETTAINPKKISVERTPSR